MQYEKHEKFVWKDLFSLLPQKTKNKGERRPKGCGKMRKIVERGIGKVESVNKNLGGEKKKK